MDKRNQFGHTPNGHQHRVFFVAPVLPNYGGSPSTGPDWHELTSCLVGSRRHAPRNGACHTEVARSSGQSRTSETPGEFRFPDIHL
ncbi:MAG: hypothetical protein O2820_07785 [Planctomycetota bacterium]|nr:hypothetical protein [Planctomycetota bacterium]MDA1249112.1 hypothetical protein [Planctomycetota bacterium]